MSEILPAALEDRLRCLMQEAWTGKVTINIKDGSILGFDLTEAYRVDRRGGVRIER